MVTLVLILLVLAAAASCAFVFRNGPKSLAIALGIYLGAYTMTSVIGALALGYSAYFGDTVLDYIELTGLEIGRLSNLNHVVFAFVLLTPYVTVPLVSWLSYKVTWRSLIPRLLRNADATIGLLPAFVFVFALIVAWCLWKLVATGLIDRALTIGNLWSDQETQLRARMHAFATLGPAYFNLVYMGLPALSFLALWAFLKHRSLLWGLTLFVCICATSFLVLITAQKAPLLVYLLFLGVCVVLWSKIKISAVIGACVLLVAMNFLGDVLLGGPFDVFLSIRDMIFRLGVALPFYVSIYPAMEPHTGIGLGLEGMGIGSSKFARVPMIVSDYMSQTSIQGFAPAAAHVTAYAEAGLPYMFAIEVAIAIIVAVTAKMVKEGPHPIRSASAAALLVMLYYVTQVSLPLAVWGSYGIVWAILPLMGLGVARSLFQAFISPQMTVGVREASG